MPASALVPFQITGPVVNKQDAAGSVRSGDCHKPESSPSGSLLLCVRNINVSVGPRTSSGDLRRAEAVLDSFLEEGLMTKITVLMLRSFSCVFHSDVAS